MVFKRTQNLVIYADGGNRNTGNVKGGHVRASDLSAWAYLMEGNFSNGARGEIIRRDAGIVMGATNNAMEITAVGKAFRQLTTNPALKDQSFDLVLDSRYVLDAFEKGWLKNWIARNDTSKANFELWTALYPMYIELEPRMTLHWVKGHDKTWGNLQVDELLNRAMDAYQ